MVYKPHNFRALSKPKQLHKSQHKHYWPYIPLLLLVVGTFLLSLAQPLQKHGVLAYATGISNSALLADTNTQREHNGAADLQLDNALTAAAQTKANDMVARNYWSHDTPDGQAPWVFIDKAGYTYQKAGENLAYGFKTSNDTVTAWMNSPPHRENLLDTSFTQVGFGFANSKDYNNSGEETVVVAMYGEPQVLAANSQATTTIPPPSTNSTAVTTDKILTGEPATQQVARIQTLTGGKAPWASFAIGTLTGLVIAFLLIKHAAGVRHLFRDSERFVLHHPLLDTLLVSLVLLGSFLSQTTGFIR